MQEEIIQENQFNSEREGLKDRLIKTTGGITNHDRELLKIYTSFLPEDSCFGERRQYLINDYTEIQKCPVCGKKRKYSKSEKKISVFCSDECKSSEKGIEVSNNNEAQNYIKSHKVAETEEELREKIVNEIGYRPKFLTDSETNIILKFTSFLPDDEETSFNERICYFINNIKEIKKCPVCGKKVYYIRKDKGLSVFCSEKCRISKEGQSLRLKNERKSILKNHVEKSENYKEAESREELKEKIENSANPAFWKQYLTEKEIDLLIEYTKFLPEEVSMSERQCYLLNDYMEMKICPVCGKRAKYLSNHHRIGIFCSTKCMRSEQGEKIIGKNKSTGFLKVKTEYPEKYKRSIKKRQITIYNKYGGKSPYSNKEIQMKGRISYRKRKYQNFIDKITANGLTLISSFDEYCRAGKGDVLEFKCNKCGEVFKHTVNVYLMNPKVIKCPCQFFIASLSYEQEIEEWINSEGFNNIERNKRFRKNQKTIEADLFLPDYNLAIEFNGSYWHSDKQKDKEYHYRKWKFFKDMNIDCIQIFENEWIYAKDIVKSIILEHLNKHQIIIDSSLCNLKEITNEGYITFLDNNYIKDSCYLNADIKIGLYYNDELVEIVSFSKSKNKKYDWMIIANCSKLNYQIKNGFLKILTYFRKIYSGSIISQIDSRYFNGKDYVNCGFKLIKHNKSKQFYIYSGGSRRMFKTIKEVNQYCKIVKNKRSVRYFSIHDAGYDLLLLE